MNELTRDLLQNCKEAGYETVTVFVTDKRCPTSVRAKKGVCSMYWGTGSPQQPFRVVCGSPAQRGVDGRGFPEIWDVIRRMGLSGGGGYDDAMKITIPSLLTAGFYDLTAMAG